MNSDALPSNSRPLPSAEEPPSSLTVDIDNEDKIRKRLKLEKRAVLLDDLLLKIDIVIYLQFSILYYME